MEFEHKGTKINFGGDGEFSAEIGGERVKKKSLDAIKKAIDAAEKDAFVPFEALINRYHSMSGRPLVVRVNVTGIIKKPRSKYDRPSFIVSGEERNQEAVAEISSEGAMRELMEFNKQSDAIDKERRKKRELIESKIVGISAATYQPKKKGEANG